MIDMSTCAWCSAPASGVDEAGDPQCDACAQVADCARARQLLEDVTYPPLERREREPLRHWIARLVRRLAYVRLHGPASEEIATFNVLLRAIGVTR